MSYKESLSRFKENVDKILAINYATSVLHWDAATGAPKSSFTVRGQSLGYFKLLEYEILITPEADNDINILKSNLSSYSFSDNETKTALKTIYSNSGYIADPHGAVGYLGAKTYLTNHPNVQTVFLETAHPTKFLDVVKDTISVDIALPPQIQLVIDQQKKAILIENYDEFKAFMLKF